MSSLTYPISYCRSSASEGDEAKLNEARLVEALEYSQREYPTFSYSSRVAPTVPRDYLRWGGMGTYVQRPSGPMVGYYSEQPSLSTVSSSSSNEDTEDDEEQQQREPLIPAPPSAPPKLTIKLDMGAFNKKRSQAVAFEEDSNDEYQPAPKKANVASNPSTSDPATPDTTSDVIQRNRANSRGNLTAGEREYHFLHDPWVKECQPNRVTCLACGNDMKLDSRNAGKFYISEWTRHRSKCTGISVMREEYAKKSGIQIPTDQYWSQDWKDTTKKICAGKVDASQCEADAEWLIFDKSAATST